MFFARRVMFNLMFIVDTGNDTTGAQFAEERNRDNRESEEGM